jgi:hypothetical protein
MRVAIRMEANANRPPPKKKIINKINPKKEKKINGHVDIINNQSS